MSDEKRKVEAYNRKVKAYISLVNIFRIIHTDYMTILKELIYAKENLLPLFDGSSKQMVSLNIDSTTRLDYASWLISNILFGYKRESF